MITLLGIAMNVYRSVSRLEMKKSSTETLIGAARVLSVDIETQDGVANAALREIADRLEEQEERIGKLDKFLHDAMHDYWLPDTDHFDLAELARNLGLMETKRMEKPCGECCMCEEHDGEFPLECLRFVSTTGKEVEKKTE